MDKIKKKGARSQNQRMRMRIKKKKKKKQTDTPWRKASGWIIEVILI